MSFTISFSGERSLWVAQELKSCCPSVGHVCADFGLSPVNQALSIHWAGILIVVWALPHRYWWLLHAPFSAANIVHLLLELPSYELFSSPSITKILKNETISSFLGSTQCLFLSDKSGLFLESLACCSHCPDGDQTAMCYCLALNDANWSLIILKLLTIIRFL